MDSTKEIFAEALRRLKLRDPNARITVKKIAEEAGFDRHTFYYHFSSIDDLISWIMDSKLISILDADGVAWENTIRSIISFFADDSWIEIAQRGSEETYRMMIEKITPLLISDIREKCAEENIRLSDDDINLIASSATWGIAGAFNRCLDMSASKRGELMADRLVLVIRHYLDDAVAVFSGKDGAVR